MVSLGLLRQLVAGVAIIAVAAAVAWVLRASAPPDCRRFTLPGAWDYAAYQRCQEGR